MGDVRKRFGNFLNMVEKREIERLKKLGERCVTHAKNLTPDDGSFEDQTLNLRSSIGYGVFNNGEAVFISYKQTPPKNPKKGTVYDGARKGEELARKVGEQTTGVCLVITAGMEYAAAVEAGRDIDKIDKDGKTVIVRVPAKDVIASAEIMAKRELPEELEKIVSYIKRAAE
jgi:hypothetical protein